MTTKSGMLAAVAAAAGLGEMDGATPIVVNAEFVKTHFAAVAAGLQAEGATAANERISKLISADGIKGNAGRTAAALDLATKSPAMSAESVVAFVASNVKEDAPETIENRTAASGVNEIGNGKAPEKVGRLQAIANQKFPS